MGHPLGFAPVAALEDLGLPLWGPDGEVVQLLGSPGFWQQQVLRGVGGSGSRKCSALEGMATSIGQHTTATLAWGNPPTEKPGRPQSTRSHRDGHDPVHIDATFFCGWQLCPSESEHEAGAAAWLAGTLVAQTVQGHGLPLPQGLQPYQSFPKPLVVGNQKASLASLSPSLPPFGHLEGSLACGPSLLLGASGT